MVVKCPHCGREIVKLFYSADIHHDGSFSTEDGWIEEPLLYQEAEYSYFCPECEKEILIFDPEEFLKGGENRYDSLPDFF